MIFKNISCLDYLKEKPNESYDLVLTDPPYGIDYVNNRRNKSGKIITENGILNDGKNNGNFIKNVLNELYRVLKDGKHLYWFGRYDSIIKQVPLIEEAGFIVKNVLIWEKNNHGTGDLIYSYAPKYECIVYAVKKATKKSKVMPLKTINGITRHQDVLKFAKVSKKNMIHDHQKPVDLLEFLIKKSSNEGDVLFEPFVGSGSLFQAANNLNRVVEGTELNEGLFNITKSKLIESNILKIEE